MMRLFFQTHVTIFPAVILALTAANALVLHSSILGAVLLVLFLASISPALGMAAAPSEIGLAQWSIGVWILGSTIAIAGSIAYYLFELNLSVSLGLLILLWLIHGWLRGRKDNTTTKITQDAPDRIPAASWLAAGSILILLGACVLLIQSATTWDAIRSPWERVPTTVFFLFGLSSLLLVALLFRGRECKLGVPLCIASLLVIFSVTVLVFPIGYGFDSFIHQATESHIAAFGTITPKPFYYIGQYAIVLFLHFAFAIPIEWADKLLLPVLAATLLPIAWGTGARHLLSDRRAAVASLPAIFLMPLTSFLVTHPQGLANLWTWLTFLFSVPYLVCHDRRHLWPIGLAAIATVLMHPIAGIPVLLFLVLLALHSSNPRQPHPRLARALSWTAIIGGSVILPISFAINAWLSGQNLQIDFSALSPERLLPALHLELFFENRFSPVLDFPYLFSSNRILLIILLAMAGLWMWRRTHLPALTPFIAMGGMLGINYLVMRAAVDFAFLIDYERANYADRLVPLALFSLSPFVILLAGRMAKRLREQPVVLRASAVTLVAAILTASFYLAYPRTDRYEMSHGYNTSQTDLDAVHAVDRDAAHQNYVVLANQSVSAAAIRELGFTHYFGDVFFYPIPTGGPLYQYFLAMNERPNLETVRSAMDLAGVDTLYFLVNDYWWQAGRIIETAKTNADDWWVIGDRTVHVFKYQRSLHVF
jgi:hypothetical protein